MKGLQGWLAVGFAICVVVMAVAAALSNADKRADEAEVKVGVVTEEKRGETIRAQTNEGVAARTSEAADVQIRVERQVHTVIRTIKAHPDENTPIPPDLARDWIAGLKRVCDEAGPEACAPADAPDRVDRKARD